MNFIKRIFGGSREKIRIPNVEGPKKDKPFKMKIIQIKNEDQLSELRDAVQDCSLIFIKTPLSLVGSERTSLLTKIKLVCKPAGKRIYGLDLQWYIVTDLDYQ